MSDPTSEPKIITRAPKDGWLLLEPEDCPLRKQHTEGPQGYVAWGEWAERMGETHRQMRCAGCHRWSVWIPR